MPNLRLKNVAGDIISLLSNTATVARQWFIPDKNGTVAMTSDITAAGAGFIFKETPTGLINSSNTIYTLTQTPISGSEHVFLNGLLQQITSDYTLSTNTITFLIAPETGDKLKITYVHV